MELIWLALPCFRLHRRKAILRPQCSYDGIFPPNSRALLPTFHTNCPDGSHFAQIGSHFAQNTTRAQPQPLFLTQPSHTPFWDMYVHKTTETPPQSTPFPGLNLKVGKINYRLGNLDPNWAKCLKC